MAEQTSVAVRTMSVVKEIEIAAPAEVVFRLLMEGQGPLKEMKLRVEAWVGGRWFRDLGEGAGHLWGHVQVIKPPKLLEIVGPMMMSFPVASHVQYRVTEKEGGGVVLKLTHQAMGMIPEGMEVDVTKGWGMSVEAVKAAAEGRG